MGLYVRDNTANHQFVFRAGGVPGDAVWSIATHWDDSAETLTALQTAVRGIVVTRLIPEIDTDVSLVRVFSQGRTSTGTLLEAENLTVTGGGRSGTSFPWNMAAVVRKSSGLAGRKHRGRIFFFGALVTGEVSQDGAITSTRRGQIDTAWNLVRTDLAARAAASTFRILHSDSVTLSDEVTLLSTDALIGNQRRRIR